MINPTTALAEFIQKFEASLDPRLWVALIEEETEEFKAGHENWLELKARYSEDDNIAIQAKAELLNCSNC